MKKSTTKKKCQICGDETTNTDYGSGPICAKCEKDGWTANPTEIVNEINKDPKLKAMYESLFGNV